MNNPLAAFIEAACVPCDGGHASGTLERSNPIGADPTTPVRGQMATVCQQIPAAVVEKA
jgi:hypothetical protein